MFSLKLLIPSLLLIHSLSILSQSNTIYNEQEKLTIDGSEIVDFTNMEIINTSGSYNFSPVNGGYFNYNIHNITDRKTGYDLQSNASTQEIWADPNNPDNLHTVFTNSQLVNGIWNDRTCLYFVSTNKGGTWTELGAVPVNLDPTGGTNGKSGFPAISGTTSGAAVITNHNNTQFTPIHTKVYIDNSIFGYNFTEHDPGEPPAGRTIWPRIAVLPNNSSVITSSIGVPSDFYINTLSSNIFSGWQSHNGDQAETYSLAVSEAGKVGLAYLGHDTDFPGDVFYTESTDGGLTWLTPLQVFDCPLIPSSPDMALGSLRGVCVSFYNELPCITFEIGWITVTNYFPELPSEIHFWSPTVNGGISKIIADSSNVPFYKNYGTYDVQFPIGRPVIGRSENFDFLFLAFNGTSGEYWPGVSTIDSTAYYAGFFMLSSDGGNNWTEPEKFTPESPLLDWRYISIAPVNPVTNDYCTVHMVAQGDTIPGSTINAVVPMPVGVTAQYYHISTEPILIPVELTSFTAQLNDHQVLLRWTTATETNNQGFEIERASSLPATAPDGTSPVQGWERIGFVEGHGTTTEPQDYLFNDDISNINATSFSYRLKQIDYDGSFEYSDEVEVINSITPDKFSLSQNYPNPFNPSTKIKYSVPEKALVTLKVYDIIGKEVATLVDEYKPAGIYQMEWNASEFPSGIYFYQLRANEFIETRKMILMK